MLLVTSPGSDDPDEEVLISGGGDGVIKIWNLDPASGGAICHPVVLENGDESVLTLALDGTLLYSGRLDGEVNVWDIETRQLVRRVKAHTSDTLTLAVGHGLVFAGSANGNAKVGPLVRPVTAWLMARRYSILGMSVWRSGKPTISSFLLRPLRTAMGEQSLSPEEMIIVLRFGRFLIASKSRKRSRYLATVRHFYLVTTSLETDCFP